MQEGSRDWNLADPDHLTRSGDFYLDKMYELIVSSEQRFANGESPTINNLEHDARTGLYVLIAIEEMAAEQIARQRDFICSLLRHTAIVLEHHDLRIFAGRITEKILEIDPCYFPVEPELTDEVPVLPKDNPLLEIPDL